MMEFVVHDRNSFESMFIDEMKRNFKQNKNANTKNARVRVGDTVCLNDTGIEICFGSVMGLGHMRTLKMEITHCEFVSEGIYSVQVDNPDINRFMISDLDFNVVKP